jgi:hypothetical protein
VREEYVFQLIQRTKLLPVLGAALLVLAMTASAAQAQATPKPGYTQFKGCPSVAEDPESLICVRNIVTGGHFQMGSKTVTIEKPITLVGGVDVNFANFRYNSAGGLSPTPQEVPGGVVGITGLDWLLDIFPASLLKLYATTELAGTPDVNVFDEPVELPIKAKLTSPSGVLGNNCYVGSNANPISLNLVTTTTNPPPPNEPISGQGAIFTFDEATQISHLKDGTFVDNSFAAPAATGCKLNLGLLNVNIDSLVNTQAGLPSPAGTNEAVQDFDAEITDSEIVYP